MLARPLNFAAATMINAALLGAASAAPTEPLPGSTAQEHDRPAGYYRMRLGDFEVTALADGSLPDPVATPVNAYLIDTGSKLVLIDTGAGTLLGPGVGGLVRSLRAAGHEPEQIDEIYMTRIRPAQVGGLLSERKAVFPNAVVRVSLAEASFWLAKSSAAAAPPGMRQQFVSVATVFKPYIAAGRLKTFDAETELMPGIRALPGSGSMSAQTVYAATSRGESLLFCGDVLSARAGAPQNPSVPFRVEWNSDSDDLPAAKRTALSTDAAANGNWVAGDQLPFPGIGHLRSAGPVLELVPVSRAAP